MNERLRWVIPTAVVAALAAVPIGLQWKRIGDLEQEMAEVRRGGGTSVVVGARQGAGAGGVASGDGGAAGLSAAAAGAKDLARALDEPAAPLRSAALLQAGYRLAEADLGRVAAAAGDISDRGDREAFLRGAFSFAAAHREPGEVVALAASLEKADRAVALRTSVEVWTEERSLLEDGANNADRLVKRFGLEAGLGVALAWDKGLRPEVAEAWLGAFSDDVGKGVMIGAFASRDIADDPERALAMGTGLAGWDYDAFLGTVTSAWATRDPAAAWAWVSENGDVFETRADGVVTSAMARLTNSDRAAAEAALAGLESPRLRRLAAAGIARNLAWREGTAAAVEWADTLSSEDEKDAAHAVIAVQAPQGIGVALGHVDGFLQVSRLIEGGAADRDGRIQAGDRIIEVDPGTGLFENLYGQTDMSRALDLIRGESGSTVRLRVVREGAAGNLVQEELEIQREQIVLPGAPAVEAAAGKGES